ncbi:MAG: regulator, partial [Acidimicrobiales bacterium]
MMRILAGTSRGVFEIEPVGSSAPQEVLSCQEVRDVTVANGSIFASTGAGLFASDDQATSWRCVGME